MAAVFDPIGLIAAIADHRVDCVLAGGLAAVLHGSPATTNDADIVPRRTPGNLERLSELLVELDARLRTADSDTGVAFDPHPALLDSMSVLYLTTRLGDLDLTFAPAALHDYDALERAATDVDIDGHTIRVAALDDVIRSKEAADRPKDHATPPILRALRDEIRRSN